MRPTKLQQIAAWCGGSVDPEYQDILVSSFCFDSRLAEEGTLFFALKGQNDGHRFLEAARAAGAAAAVCSEKTDTALPVVMVEDTREALHQIAAAYRRSMDCKTVAITGSVGKTTTRTMLSAIMQRKYHTCSTMGNFNNDIGLPITIGKTDPECELLVLEMGMNHFGEMRLLTSIGQPDTVLITNIGSMHIENLGSREGILKAKLEILEGLHPGGIAFFNGDEPLLWDLKERRTENTLYFGIENPDVDIRASDLVLHNDGSRFTVTGLNHAFQVNLPLVGVHNIYNALAAISVALLYEVPEDDIEEVLACFVNTSQRQQTIVHRDMTLIDDTYNAGPESMEAALRVLRDTPVTQEGGRHIAVLGDMLELGNISNAEHHRMGRIAAFKADILLTYGEQSKHMVSGAITGGMSQRNVMNFTNQAELLNVLKSRARPGDVILFKGSHSMHMDEVLKQFMKAD